MKNRVLLFLFLIPMSFGIVSFDLPKRIYSKVSKEIKTAYSIEIFSLEEISISDAVNDKLITKIKKDNLFKIFNDSTLVGYAFIAKAPSKTDKFDYLVLFDLDFIITKIKVLIYREDYGSEIGSKRWLRQFIGKTVNDELKYEKDIIAISGATISAYSMTVAVNNLLQSIQILIQEKAL